MLDLASILDERVGSLAEKCEFCGCVLVAWKGRVIYKKGYGMSNYELAVPNSPATVFRIGSLTKGFTAMSVLQLFEKGLLKPEDNLAKYLPEYPDGERITIHHLLSHQSGTWNHTTASNIQEIHRKYHSVDQLIDTFKDVDLEFEPGTKFKYSNSGYILLGKLIEIVSGQTYEEYVQTNILAPLAMHSSGYDHAETIIKGRASGYSVDAKGRLCNAHFIDMSTPYSAGGLYSSIDDLYKWDQALYTDDLLSYSWLSKAFEPYSQQGYGYGWFVHAQPRRLAGHAGGVNGFRSMMLRYLDDKATVIVLSNIQRDVTQLAMELGEMMFNQPNEN